jgi:Tfp pilus assembly protein PilN
MIKVNLIGESKKIAKPVERGKRSSGGGGFDVWLLVWVGVFLGSILLGAYWYRSLRAESDDLTDRIEALMAQRDQLQAVIDQDAIYEQRKAALESRVGAIERLQRNQVSPIVSLDMISTAVENTEYVWLSQLGQADTRFTIGGTGTSITAISDFIYSLEETGYFRNIDLLNVQADGTNFQFQLNGQFVSPSLARN